MRFLLLAGVGLVLAQGLGLGAELAGKSLLVGAAGGLAGGLVAGAIGLVSIPLIILFLGIPVHQAVATNLFQTAITAGTGAWRHGRRGAVDLKIAWPVVGGALLGAPLGALVGLRVPADTMTTGFAAIVALLGLWMAFRAVRPRRAPRVRGGDHGIPLGLALGAGLGFVSGLLGIGGGFLVTPGLMAVFGLPVHLALGTALVVVSANGLFGTLPHLVEGNVLFTVGGLLAIGGMLGVRVGASIAHLLPPRLLRSVFAVLLGIVAWRMA